MIFQVARFRLRPQTSRLILAITFVLIATALASSSDGAPALKANDLLRQAVANEDLNGRNDYYAWVDRVQKPRGSVTKLMVNTPQGILGRTIALNDKALTLEERQQDDERTNRLLDPQKMHEKAKKQQEDQQHIERLLLALPDAFQCEYASSMHEERNLVRLECSPNQNFSPPNYESQVLQGMKSVILIDREEKRIARIEGTLFRDVTFAWGFLGRLNRGGHIEITQSRVAGKHWGLTRMQLYFEGRVIVVKPLKIEQTQTSWDYRPVPQMNVEQALEFLRNSPVQALPSDSRAQHKSPAAIPDSHASILH